MHRLTIRIILLLGLVFSFFTGMAPAPDIPSAPQITEASELSQIGVGRMRFVNATTSREPLRIVANNQLVATTVVDVAGYFTFNSGDYTIIFQNNGGQEVGRTEITLENASRMTFAMVGADIRSGEIISIVDDASPTVRNRTRLRVVNAVEGSSAAPVSLNGEEVFAPLGFGEVSNNEEVVAGGYDLQLGDKTPGETVIEPGRYYIVFFIGADNAANPVLKVVLGRPFRVSGENRYRFMNLVEVEEGQAETSYDVYVNGEDIPTYTDVDFGQATNEYVVAPGEYTFDIFNTGADPDADAPITSVNLTIAENQSLFLIATGTPDAVEVRVFADDVTPVPVNTARLQVINLTNAIPEFGVQSQAGIQLLDQVPFGSMVGTNVPGGNYALSLVDVDNPEQQLGRGEAVAVSGSLATMVVYGSESQRWVFFNETIDQVAIARVVHASPTVGTVDIYLNGDLVLNNLSYGEFTDYLTLPADNYVLTVHPDGVVPDEETEPLWRDNLSITDNAIAYTMVAAGTENFRVNVYADNLELIPPGQARIRFIHAVINAQNLNVINAANSGVLANLTFGGGSPNLNVNANTRTFTFNVPGGGFIYRIESQTLVPGGYYSFVIFGDAAQPDTLSHAQLEVLP